MADGSRRRKIIASFLAPAAATVFLVATGTAPAQAASPNCAQAEGHWYGEGASGTGNYGTYAQIYTWSSWNVPNEAEQNFSNESVWSIDYNNFDNSLEVGFMVGWANGNLIGGENHTNGEIPYYTLDDGGRMAVFWGVFLPRDTLIAMYAQSSDSGSYAYVNGQLSTTIDYAVSQPRWGYAQGEVTEDTATMGGGGDDATEYWIDSSGVAHQWAYINTCEDSPYWALSVNGTSDFENGGPS